MGQSAVLEYSTRSPSLSASDTTARARKKGTHVEQPVVAQCRSFLLQPSVDVVLDELHSHKAQCHCVLALRRDRRVARNGLRWSQWSTRKRWRPSESRPMRTESVLMRIGRDSAAHARGNQVYPTIVCGRSAAATSRRFGAQSAVVGN